MTLFNIRLTRFDIARGSVKELFNESLLNYMSFEDASYSRFLCLLAVQRILQHPGASGS